MTFPCGTITEPTIQCYGCCKCQTTHYEPEPLFRAHIGHQSKHGLLRTSKRFYEEKVRPQREFKKEKR